MKKIIFLSLLVLLFSFGYAHSAKAEDTIEYCSCDAGETVGGKKCASFTSSTLLKANCPSNCFRFDTQPEGVECIPFNTTVSGPVETPKDSSGKIVKLENPLSDGKTDVPSIIGKIINGALGIMGALVLLMIVWGGFTWLTAAGNPEKIKSGANTIVWAIVGAVVVLGSYFLLTTVLKALAG